MWLVAILASAFCPYLEGGGSHVGKSSVVALVFGFVMDSCQTSVILNHCIKGVFFFLVCVSCNVRVRGTELVVESVYSAVRTYSFI
jgi:hypothetical protein